MQLAAESIPDIDDRLSLNQPTGNFFYDRWEMKSEYKGTVWDTILALLGTKIGEARLIKLESATTYPSHADVDDRWHLNLTGVQSYLIDLETTTMYPLSRDGVWFNMNAGVIHTASNFGQVDRVQLVVRQLLTSNILNYPIEVTLVPTANLDTPRYIFDKQISPWLNYAIKRGVLSNFSVDNLFVSFTLEKEVLVELTAIALPQFTIIHTSF